MKHAITNDQSSYYNFGSGTFTDIEHDCLLPSRSIAEYVLEPIGDHLMTCVGSNSDEKSAEEALADSSLQIVDVDHMDTTQGYAVLTSEGLFYNFETDVPGTLHEKCILPSRAIADNIVNELHEGSFYYTRNQMPSASEYIKKTTYRVALFVIEITPQVRQLVCSPESTKWKSLIKKEQNPIQYSLYCALYLRYLGYSYPFISQMLGKPASLLYKQSKPYEQAILHRHEYTDHELMTLLKLSYPTFNKQLEKEAFPAPDGIHSNGIRYWKHSTVTPLLNGIQKRYIRAELQRLLKLYHTKFNQLMTEGKIPPADGIYPNGRRYWEYTTIKHLLPTTPNKNKALEAPI